MARSSGPLHIDYQVVLLAVERAGHLGCHLAGHFGGPALAVGGPLSGRAIQRARQVVR